MDKGTHNQIMLGFITFTVCLIWVVGGIVAYWLFADSTTVEPKAIITADIDMVPTLSFSAGDRVQIVKRICSNGRQRATVHKSLRHVTSGRIIDYAHALETYRDGCGTYICEIQLPDGIDSGDWQFTGVLEIESNPIRHTFVDITSNIFNVK